MKLKTRKFLFVLMTIFCMFTNISVGFSTWIIVENHTVTEQVDIITEDAVNLRQAFNIETKNLKIGKYLYEEDNTNSLTGTIRYDFKVDVNKLPSYMIKEDGKCYLTFTGELSFSDTSFAFFTSEYISGVSYTNSSGTTNIDISYQNSKLMMQPFSLVIDPTDNEFSITFTFTQKCILNDTVKDMLTNKDNYFKLSLICGGE